MKRDTTGPAAEATEERLFDNWFDPVESTLRSRVRGFLETMIEEELAAVLGRPRYGRLPEDEADKPLIGHRHGRRTRTLSGTFGQTEITVPRARIACEDGKSAEWKSKALRSYQRRTMTIDAVIASAYLSGTNTRRVKRVLASLFADGVGKDVVSRVWHKVKGDWDASYEGLKVNQQFPVSGELRFSKQRVLCQPRIRWDAAIPDHDPVIREREFGAAAPFWKTAPLRVLGVLRRPSAFDRKWREDESRFYAVFVFAPSGMTPSLA